MAGRCKLPGGFIKAHWCLTPKLRQGKYPRHSHWNKHFLEQVKSMSRKQSELLKFAHLYFRPSFSTKHKCNFVCIISSSCVSFYASINICRSSLHVAAQPKKKPNYQTLFCMPPALHTGPGWVLLYFYFILWNTVDDVDRVVVLGQKAKNNIMYQVSFLLWLTSRVIVSRLGLYVFTSEPLFHPKCMV